MGPCRAGIRESKDPDMKKLLSIALAAVLLLPAASPVLAKSADEPRPLGVESSIAFPNDATIKTWEADGEDGIWIQTRHRDWYYGKFATICRDLDFAHGIGIDNRGTAQLRSSRTCHNTSRDGGSESRCRPRHRLPTS